MHSVNIFYTKSSLPPLFRVSKKCGEDEQRLKRWCLIFNFATGAPAYGLTKETTKRKLLLLTKNSKV